MDVLKLYLNGKWVESKTEDFIEVENPATKEIIARVPAAKEEDTKLAIKGAKEAFTDWKNTPIEERIEYVEKMYDYFKDHADELTTVIHKELGCPLKFSRKTHVEAYFNAIEDMIRIAKEMELVEERDGFNIYKEGVGVVACLTPWNYPFGQIVKKVIPALLMGNTVVLKPSQNTPLTAYFFGYAAEAANLPKGVFQLVIGRGSEVGNVLAESDDVDMVSFTGSTKGGKEVGKLALNTVKKIGLELGGKSPAVILEGADLDKSLNSVLGTVYYNVGQTCSAKTRLIAPRKMKEEIESKLIELSEKFNFGDPKDSDTDVGPLQNKKQLEKVSSYVEIGKKEGELLYQGEKCDGNGYYFPPTIFTEVDPDARIAQEEIFGPVLAVIYYDTVEEAIEIANNSIYGLAGMVFGPEEEAIAVAKEIRTGQVQVNEGVFNHYAPFGGYKQSGIGREASKYGVEEFVEIKTIFV